MAFTKGKSGNAAGRPKRTPKEEAKRRHQRALDKLWRLAHAKGTPPHVQVAALTKWLEYEHGKPSAAAPLVDAEAEAMRLDAELKRMDNTEVARRIAKVFADAIGPFPAAYSTPVRPEPVRAPEPAPSPTAHPEPTGEPAAAPCDPDQPDLSVLAAPDPAPVAPTGASYAGSREEQGLDPAAPRIVRLDPRRRR